MTKRVLIVEDDRIVLRSLERALSHHGFTTKTAGRVNDARVLLQASSVDVCVLDLHLGNDWGLSLVDELIAAEIRIIVLSGYLSVTMTRHMLVDLGVSDVLLKPVDFDRLLRAINVHTSVMVPSPSHGTRSSAPPVYKLTLAQLEREHIDQILIELGGNISKAARVLGLHRQSLQRKLRKLTSAR